MTLENKIQNPFLRKNLKFLREYCELTQQQIADILHIDRSTYTYWERGKATPPLQRITELMEFYKAKGIELDYNLLLGNFIISSIMQEESIHCNQDRENCYIDKGDLIEIKPKFENKTYVGEIIDIGVRIQNGTEYDGIHSCITIGLLPKDENGYSDLVMFWVETIAELKVLRLGR